MQSNNDRIFKEKESIGVLKTIGLIEENLRVLLINMSDEKVSQNKIS